MHEITVMLADDEKLFIENILSIFEWDKNGFKIVACVSNGKQALKKFKELHPKVVITDIRMPFMDGIDLIREIRKQDSNTKIILLTAYGDFKYAQQAINEGITNYILKDEVDPAHILKLMCSIKGQIKSEEYKQDILVQNAARDYFCNGYNTIAGFESGMHDALKVPSSFIIINEDLPISLSEHDDKRNPLENIEKALNLVRHFEDGEFCVRYAFSIGEDIILAVKTDSNRKNIFSDLDSFALIIIKMLKKSLDKSFTVFTVCNRLNLREISSIYRKHCERMKSKYFLGSGKVYNFLNDKLDMHETKVKLDMDEINRAFSTEDESIACNYINSLYKSVSFPTMNYREFLNISWKLYDIFEVESKKDSGYPELLDMKEGSNPNIWFSTEDVRNWIEDRFARLIRTRREGYLYRLSPEVRNSIKYILKNYMNRDLKIDDIAYNVGLSAGRLSVIFKKEMDLTINEYITKVRIDRAKELLECENFKVYEVANSVGYGSSQYFSHIFFNITGLNPLDFKKGRELAR